MSSMDMRVRQFKKYARYIKGYFEFDRATNKIVRRTDFANCPRPVLLLYGFMSTRQSFEILEHRLRRDNFCVWSINLGGWKDLFNTNAIDQLAEKVRDKVERLYQRFPGMGPLSIVGHSKGGLIASYYVKRLGGAHRVKNVVTLGTPFNGSPSAYFGIAAYGMISRSIWQLTPRSPFIHRLKMGAFPADVKLTSIYSRSDRVNPAASCVLEASAPNLTNIEVPNVVHRELLTNRSVYQEIRKSLFTGLSLPVPEEPRSERLRRLTVK